MFLRTLMCGQSAYDWKTMPILRLLGGTSMRCGRVEHDPVSERDVSFVCGLEPREAAKRGGLSAPARPQQDEELAGLDLEIERVDRGRRRLAAEALGEPADRDARHGRHLPACRRRPDPRRASRRAAQRAARTCVPPPLLAQLRRLAEQAIPVVDEGFRLGGCEVAELLVTERHVEGVRARPSGPSRSSCARAPGPPA